MLDLDETLVHCSVDPIPDADLTFGVEFNGANYMVYVRKRPFLDRFLELVYEKFEVTVFTASQVRPSSSSPPPPHTRTTATTIARTCATVSPVQPLRLCVYRVIQRCPHVGVVVGSVIVSPQRVYAEKLLDLLDVDKKYIRCVCSVHSCGPVPVRRWSLAPVPARGQHPLPRLPPGWQHPPNDLCVPMPVPVFLLAFAFFVAAGTGCTAIRA